MYQMKLSYHLHFISFQTGPFHDRNFPQFFWADATLNIGPGLGGDAFMVLQEKMASHPTTCDFASSFGGIKDKHILARLTHTPMKF